MPRNNRAPLARKNIRIPKLLMDEVDGIVEGGGLYVSRQQFVESAIREKIERARLLEGSGVESGGRVLLVEANDDFLARIKDSFLLHSMLRLARGKTILHGGDLEDLAQKARAYVRTRARIEGRKLTEKEIDRLADDLFRYQKEMFEGLNVLSGIES